MVNEQIIDAPEEQFAKSRVVQMRMNIVSRRARDDSLDAGSQVGDRSAGRNAFHCCCRVAGKI